MFNWIKRQFQKKPISARKFEAAVNNRLTQWTALTESPDAPLRDGGLRIIRDRARDLVQNDDFAKRYLQLLSNNVLGHEGIKLEMNVRDTGPGGVDLGPDEQANRIIEARWKEFCKHPTTDGKLNMVALQNQVLSSVARDGEIFYQKAYNIGQSFGLFPIEADHLADDYNVESVDGVRVRMSVGVDQWGRVLHYRISSGHPGDRGAVRRYTVVPGSQILHVYKPDRALDTRGVSWLASSIVPLKQLKEYFRSETIAARIASAKMGFFTQDKDVGEGYSGDGEREGTLAMDVAPGQFTQLPKGVGIQTFDPQNPHSNFDSFTKVLLRKTASGMGVSYNALANDLESVNYSSYRAGVLEDREFYKCIQRWLIDSFLTPVFESWLKHELETGAFKFPSGGALRVERFDKFNAPRWIARRWPWVDPAKDAKAAIELINNNIRSRGDVIAENYGGNHADLMQKIAEEKKLEAEMGIKTASEEVLNRPIEQEPKQAQNSEEIDD